MTQHPSTERGAGDAPEAATDLTSFRAIGFFPADHATIESGKVYASGAYWASLRFPAFPAVLPQTSLVAVIEVPFHANQANHTFEMGLLDPDGQPNGVKVQAVFRTAPGIDLKYGQAGLLPAAVPISGLVFPRAGDYSFTLSVDGKFLARYPFAVVQVATVAPMQLPAPPTVRE